MKAGWCALIASLASGSAFAAQVEMFSPQGEVKGVRQVAVRFSEPMVAFGDPRLPEPFAIDCAAAGTGRWADQKNWIYDFSRDLPAGVRCSFSLKPELAALSGSKLEGAAAYEFSTGGPAVLETLPYEEAIVDEEQMFILGLDAPASGESVLANAYCDVQGVTERVPVRLIQGEQRKALLAARRDFMDRWLGVLLKDGRNLLIDGRPFGRGTRFEDLVSADESKVPVTVVQCQRRLPNNAEVRLVWGKGISSTSGVATSQDQGIAFRVREVFQAKFSCERANKDAGCLPILPMRLSFTAPLSREQAAKIVLRPAGAKPLAATLPDARNAADFVDEVSFPGPFPERAQFTIEIPAALTDDAGRRLVNQKRFPLAVRTDEYPPLAKFPSRFGIIELKGDGAMPVTLRNLEAMVEARVAMTGKQDDPRAELADKADAAINWLKNKLDESKQEEGTGVPGGYSRVADGDVMAMLGWLKRMRQMENDRWRYDEKKKTEVIEYQVGQDSIFNERDRVKRMNVPKPQGARAFEVVGIPLKKPGFYVVELASPRLGASLLSARDKPYYVQSAALVTNLAVHFKWGRESSLAWVTALDTGSPVAKAQVAVQDCSGKVYFRGQTDAQGRARLAVALPDQERLPPCLAAHDRQMVVSARLGEDLSFVMSAWNEGISRWRFNLRSASWSGPYIATTVFDRSLLRAGETVGMKHYYRRHGIKGFSFLPPDTLPRKVVIQHQGSEEKYELPVAWDGRSSAETVWKIPPGAKKGMYSVMMTDMLESRPGSRGSMRVSGSFRVEEFRVPLMKAAIAAPKAAQVNPKSVLLDLSLRYLSGGGAGNAPVKVRSVLRPKTVTFADFDGFTFANGKVAEGIEQHGESRWHAGEYEFDDPDSGEPATATIPGIRPLKLIALDLDASGTARVTVPGLPASDSPQELNAEFEYADPSGEMLTTSTRVALWPSRVILGIKPDSWAASQDLLKFQVLALDLAGKPVKGQAVRTQLYVREMFSHRKRLAGGFYGYESGAEIRKLETVCEGVTDERGRLNCAVKPPVSGNILMAAEAKDRDGNASWANGSAWVAGNEAWWFDQSNDDRMDVIPERKRYEPGETAQFQVRMPFREATALVTVEREGVIESFVQPLSGAAPVVKVAIKGGHAPNVFVSVLAVRGRVTGVQPTALVDLGKPAFKMGVAEISVGWKAHELGVKVTADRQSYKVREKARVTVQVTQRAGGKPPKSGEVAIAAVDEGLLELLPNDSWKLLDAMMRPRGIEVETSTASMQVVGKRHYGRKAMPHGGGGGRETSRELFDTLLLWKGRVALDAKGRASVEIPLNDSLTAFRIIAVADSGNGLFGTGQTSIRATQDLMLLSGVPPLVREGDRFEAGFTVRNASARQMEVEVNGNVEGQALPAVRLALAAGEAREAKWEVTVPVSAAQLRWEVVAAEVNASGKSQADRLKVQHKIIAAVPVRTFQATLAQLDQPLELVVKIPDDAVPGRGGVRLSLLPRLGDELAGVREFMGGYPYICLEQRASRAIALRDAALWAHVMNDLPSYLDRDGFARYFPSEREGSDTLTAYLLAIGSEAGWLIPEGPLARMQDALRMFVSGRTGRESPLPSADLTIRKLAALDALSRYGPIEPSLLDSIEIAPNLWPTSAVLDWNGVLARSDSIADREQRLAEAGQIVRARLSFQGTAMGFSTERLDYLWWLMISGDVNANRVLLSFLDAPSWREEIPRLVRGTLGRQRHGHWNTTVSNAWGVL
ncbi:MAG TPA: alpha-2-macroglobulin family protein, partial [Burkholderiales bacterium]